MATKAYKFAILIILCVAAATGAWMFRYEPIPSLPYRGELYSVTVWDRWLHRACVASVPVAPYLGRLSCTTDDVRKAISSGKRESSKKNPKGLEELKSKLSDAGFTEKDIEEFVLRQKKRAQELGFEEHEIEQHLNSGDWDPEKWNTEE